MEESMFCNENGKPFPRTNKFDMELYNKEIKKQSRNCEKVRSFSARYGSARNTGDLVSEEIEKQAEEYTEENGEKYNTHLSSKRMIYLSFQDGAKWGMETICKKILEEVDKDIFIGDGTNVRLRKIIKKLGVDL